MSTSTFSDESLEHSENVNDSVNTSHSSIDTIVKDTFQPKNTSADEDSEQPPKASRKACSLDELYRISQMSDSEYREYLSQLCQDQDCARHAKNVETEDDFNDNQDEIISDHDHPPPDLESHEDDDDKDKDSGIDVNFDDDDDDILVDSKPSDQDCPVIVGQANSNCCPFRPRSYALSPPSPTRSGMMKSSLKKVMKRTTSLGDVSRYHPMLMPNCSVCSYR